ncbi:hypothetical protein [Helicobacter pylori]|uniref:hypothetical protein n=1 Tax=Helicobacter pylori TaxID=210 RepID=UPI0018D01E39|nr:hypothetical protein [Helicobacter pylori]MBH0306281.1 hypothetical protein [Helicobacter pylori]
MKALGIESEARTKSLLMAQSLFLKPNNHNIVTTASLMLNSGAFLQLYDFISNL